MTTKINVKMGDTAAAQSVALLDHDGVPATLTGATVVMQVSGHDTAIACTVVDAAEGRVAPGRGTLTPDAGKDFKEFDVEFEATFTDQTVQTFPERGYATLVVWRDLDPVDS